MNIEELANLIDSKVVFTTPDGTFEGMLKLILVESNRLTFEHVFCMPSREYLGTMHILLEDISSYEIVEPACEPTWRYGLKENLPAVEKYTSDYLILDSFSQQFTDTIENLSKLNSIGVSFHGARISRFGNLSWVCLYTPSCVFMFDIEELGNKAFHEGLKQIFENEKIQKVIHDCREASDCLLHKFQTNLKNVFDTQVADFIINMQMHTGKEMFKYVNALDSCLVAYLKVPQHFLYNRNRCLSYDEEIKFFQIRPISDAFQNVLIKSTMYLISLKEVQESLLLQPFQDAVDVYLNIMRTATDSEVYREPTEFTQSAPAYLLGNTKCVRFSNS